MVDHLALSRAVHVAESRSLPIQQEKLLIFNNTDIAFYFIDTDEIPGFLLLLKNHIFTGRNEHIIFIFRM